jgi:hypothetical protein
MVWNGRGGFRTCDYVGADLDYVGAGAAIEAIEVLRAPFGTHFNVFTPSAVLAGKSNRPVL